GLRLGLSWLLAESSLRESYRRETDVRLSLSAVMEHSAGNALAMTDVDELRRTLFVDSHTAAIEPRFDLRHAINIQHNLRFIKGSLDTLSFGYSTAKAFIGLSEMTSSCERRPLRGKFQAQKAYRLSECLKHATEMVEAYGRVNNRVSALACTH